MVIGLADALLEDNAGILHVHLAGRSHRRFGELDAVPGRCCRGGLLSSGHRDFPSRPVQRIGGL